ncbi:2617_t:CDS:2, partial [Acaulospora morrowiae]
ASSSYPQPPQCYQLSLPPPAHQFQDMSKAPNLPAQCPSCHLILNQILLKDSLLAQYQNVSTMKDNLIMTQRELIYNLMKFVGCDLKEDSSIYSVTEGFARKEVDFVKSVNRMICGSSWQGQNRRRFQNRTRSHFN